MRASEYRDAAEQLRADGLTTGQIIERWTAERGLNPREAARLSHGGRRRLTSRPRRRRWSLPGRARGSGGCCVAAAAGTQGDGRRRRHGQRPVPG